MPSINELQLAEIQIMAGLNDGRCDTCHQTIKVYTYKLSRSHANFLKAMAGSVHDSGMNNVDIGELNVGYSVRSQVTKMRQHGLIARIKNDNGKQIARHWLITHKGWKFLNGESVPQYVVVYNNQVLGHEGELVNIFQVLGEKADPTAPAYLAEPVSPHEARELDNIREPQRKLKYRAKYKLKSIIGKFTKDQVYDIEVERLQIGRPVIVEVEGERMTYRDIASFRKSWGIS